MKTMFRSSVDMPLTFKTEYRYFSCRNAFAFTLCNRRWCDPNTRSIATTRFATNNSALTPRWHRRRMVVNPVVTVPPLTLRWHWTPSKWRQLDPNLFWTGKIFPQIPTHTYTETQEEVVEDGACTSTTEKPKKDIASFSRTGTGTTPLRRLRDRRQLGCLESPNTLNSKGKVIAVKP